MALLPQKTEEKLFRYVKDALKSSKKKKKQVNAKKMQTGFGQDLKSPMTLVVEYQLSIL